MVDVVLKLARGTMAVKMRDVSLQFRLDNFRFFFKYGYTLIAIEPNKATHL